jgi:hypothetical protein
MILDLKNIAQRILPSYRLNKRGRMSALLRLENPSTLRCFRRSELVKR